MIDQNENLLGVGIYTIPEAAKLTGVASSRIRRWIIGYSYAYDGEMRSSSPVWESELPVIEDKVAIGFHDLVETRFINAFITHGVSLRTIRLASLKASEILGTRHPFATQRFMTDGRDIFYEAVTESGDNNVLDIIKSQYAFKQIISPALYKTLEFSESDELLRWWPIGKAKKVVIDPRRSFGQPIVSNEGVPTVVLADAYRVEGSYKRVANIYDVSITSVKVATEFERKLAA